MSSEKQIEFTKGNMDTYLKEVAKEYRKQIGKHMPTGDRLEPVISSRKRDVRER